MSVVVTAGPPRVAAPGFIRENVAPAVEQHVNERFAAEFAAQGVEVMTASEVVRVLEAQKLGELADCEAGACVGELGTVLSVDALLLGTVAKTATGFQLDSRLVSTADGSIVTTFSRPAPTEAALDETVKEAARTLAPRLGQKLGRPLTPLTQATPTPNGPPAGPARPFVRYERVNTPVRNVGKWALIGGAAAFGITGLGFFLAPKACPIGDTCGFSQAEDAWATGMLVSLGVIAVGVLVYVIGGTELKPVTASLVPLPGGGGLFAVSAPW